MEWIVSPLAAVSAKDVLLLLLGVLLTYVSQHGPTYLANYRKVTPLLGAWHSYHWSRVQGKAVFRHGQYTFSRGWSGLRVEVRKPGMAATEYLGKVSFEGNDFIIDAEARRDTERILMRVGVPIHHEAGKTEMIGFQLGIDFDREKYAAVKVFAQSALSISDAQARVAQVADLVAAEAALRVKRSAQQWEQPPRAVSESAA